MCDYQRALTWYERLLGSGPTFFPNATEAVRELTGHRYLYIKELPERAGTVTVPLTRASAPSACRLDDLFQGHTGRPLARCLLGQVLFQRPPVRTTRASFRCTWLSSDYCVSGGWLPGVDGLVAGGADHEGLPAHLGHELRPRGLWLSRPGEVGEFADLVDFHPGTLVAPLAPARCGAG